MENIDNFGVGPNELKIKLDKHIDDKYGCEHYKRKSKFVVSTIKLYSNIVTVLKKCILSKLLG